MSLRSYSLKVMEETCRQLERERDLWKRRYKEQHRTVHRLEDELADLRAYAADEQS